MYFDQNEPPPLIYPGNSTLSICIIYTGMVIPKVQYVKLCVYMCVWGGWGEGNCSSELEMLTKKNIY